MNQGELVRKFVVDNFLFGDGGDLSEETSLLGSGVIDSTGILELINYLEQAFNITVEDNDIIPENLDSLRNISCYLEHKLNGTPSTPSLSKACTV
jgi:acyl carrier protein